MKADSPRFRGPSASPALVGIAIFCAIASTTCHKKNTEGASAATAKIPARIETLKLIEVPRFDEYLASLTSRRSIALYPHVSGYVKAISVKPGDPVTEGALIIAINPGRELATLKSLEANLQTRRAHAQFAVHNDSKSQALLEAGLIGDIEYQRRYSLRVAAEADVKQAEAQLKSQADLLGFYSIIAPSDGVVGDVPVRVGDYVTPQTRLTSVDQDKLIEAYIYIPIPKANAIDENTVIQLVDNSRIPLCETKPSFVSTTVNVDTQTVLVKATCPNAGKLRAAQVLTARMIWGREPRLTMPISAVSRLVGTYFAFVADRTPDGVVARQRPIDVEGMFENSFIITSGVKAGEEVIVSNVQRMLDGTHVASEPRAAE